MLEILENILHDIDRTKAIIEQLKSKLKKTRNSADMHRLNEKIMVAEDMLQDLHIRAAGIEKYLKESENRK